MITLVSLFPLDIVIASVAYAAGRCDWTLRLLFHAWPCNLPRSLFQPFNRSAAQLYLEYQGAAVHANRLNQENMALEATDLPVPHMQALQMQAGL